MNNFQKTLKLFTESKATPLKEDVVEAGFPDEFEEFFDAYIEAALFTSHDELKETGGDPLDANYSIADINAETLSDMRHDCAMFFNEQYDLLGRNFKQAGHDFWLTRNGHGAGFWDGDWPEDVEQILTMAATKFGNYDLYIGDDGQIYGS